MANFDKLSRDRFSQNVQRAFGTPGTGLFTGDITKGEVVEVTFSAAMAGSATIKPRRTGAILLEVDLDTICEYMWVRDGTKLRVTLNGNRTGSLLFWVF